MSKNMPPPLDLSLRDGLALNYASRTEGIHGLGLEAVYSNLRIGRKTPPSSVVYGQMRKLEKRGYLDRGVLTEVIGSPGPARRVRRTTLEGTKELSTMALVARLLLAGNRDVTGKANGRQDPAVKPADMALGSFVILHGTSYAGGAAAKGFFDRYSLLEESITGNAAVLELRDMEDQGWIKNASFGSAYMSLNRQPYFIEPLGRLVLERARPFLEIIQGPTNRQLG